MNSILKKLSQIYCLKSVERISTQVIHKLSTVFGSIDFIFDASLNDLILLGKLHETTAKNILIACNNIEDFIDEAEFELNKLSKLDCTAITYWNDDYPELLKRIYSPPLVLYATSAFQKNHEISVSYGWDTKTY